jgi:predicted transglutaminase-like cysteine proteinase
MRGLWNIAGAIALLGVAGIVAATPVEARSKAPLGYQLMCLKTPAECRGGGKSSVEATAELIETLERVNARINRNITPRSDGAVDVWSATATAGDCEDYALAKRRALIGAGLPPSALRIAYVKTPKGDGHAILIVKTNRGDYVLDNLSRAVRTLKETGYRILSMSGADPLQWT